MVGDWLPSMHWEGGVGFSACTGKGVVFPAFTGRGVGFPACTGTGKSGRYAFYWNAFLLPIVSPKPSFV